MYRLIYNQNGYIVTCPEAVHYQDLIENFVLKCTEWAVKADFDNVEYMWNRIYAAVKEKKKEGKYPVNMIVEMRVVKASKALLSAAKGNSEDRYCFFEILGWMDKDTEFDEVSLKISRELMNKPEMDMRFHWPKMWQTVPEDELNVYLRKAYGENLVKFENIRKKMDPEGMFLSDYFSKLLKQ